MNKEYEIRFRHDNCCLDAMTSDKQVKQFRKELLKSGADTDIIYKRTLIIMTLLGMGSVASTTKEKPEEKDLGDGAKAFKIKCNEELRDELVAHIVQLYALNHPSVKRIDEMWTYDKIDKF